MSGPAPIDARMPRFAAGVTSILLLGATYLALVGLSTAKADLSWFAASDSSSFAFIAGSSWAISYATVLQRALDPGFLLTSFLAALFLWGVIAPRSAPWAVIFRGLIRPRLAATTEWEDPRPPRFSQGVGLFVLSIGLMLHLAGVPWALPLATAAAFLAAFLNAAFAFCLGCQLYLVLQRVGVIGRTVSAS